MTVIIPGLGTVPVSKVEYTSEEVIKKYVDNLAILQQIFNESAGTTNEQDLTNLLNGIQNLQDLLKNGVESGNPPIRSFLLKDLAIKLSAVLQSLDAVGINGSTQIGTTPTEIQSQLDALEAWKRLASAGVTQVITDAANVGSSPTRTLQSMINVEFIRQGNEIISNQFSKLEDALNLTQQSMDALNVILGIANQIQPPTADQLVLPNFSDPTQFVQEYKRRAQELFNQKQPIPNPTDDAANQLLAARDKLTALLPKLQASAGSGDTTNTLFDFVDKVVKDINKNFEGVTIGNQQDMKAAVGIWIMDNQDARVGSTSGQQTGAIRDNILQAISAAQSLNDTQKEDVKRVSFIYDEFIKTASALLKSISQIIEKIAQKAEGR